VVNSNSKESYFLPDCVLPCVLFYKHIPAVMEHLPSLKLTLPSYIQTHGRSGQQQWSAIAFVWWGILYAYYVFKSSPASLVSSYCIGSMHAQNALMVNLQHGPLTTDLRVICISSENSVWETTAATNNSSKLRLTATTSSQPQMASPRPTHSPFTQLLMHIAYKNDLTIAAFQRVKVILQFSWSSFSYSNNSQWVTTSVKLRNVQNV